MRIILTENYEEISSEAADLVRDLIKKKPDLVFCLPAGASPVGMYRRLVQMYQEKKVDFSSMIAFDFDEYLGLGPENENSYAYFMRENFLKYVNVPRENIHYPDALAEDVEAACADYGQKIIDHGGFDLAITGIGDDGHIGYNEPAAYLRPRTHKAKLTQTTRKQNGHYFKDISEMPEYAITIGMEEIMKTRNFLVLSSGESKAPLLGRLFENDHIDPMYPVSFLRMHLNATFIIDKAAASQIPQRVLEYYK